MKDPEKEIRNHASSPRILPTFDMDDALTRLGGNEPLMLDLMAKFVEIYSDAVPEIEKLIEEGKTTDALRSAHTLKSVAGNISAKALYGVARDLETAIREARASGLEPLVARLNDELNTAIIAARCILESIRPSFEAGSEMTGELSARPIEAGCLSTSGVGGSRLALALRKLNGYIQEHDPVGSRESLAFLATILPGKGLNAHVDSIAARLASYDFEEAMQSVEDLARDIRTVQNQ